MCGHAVLLHDAHGGACASDGGVVINRLAWIRRVSRAGAALWPGVGRLREQQLEVLAVDAAEEAVVAVDDRVGE